MEIHCSTLYRPAPPNHLFYALIAAKENGRALHGFILHIPPLERTWDSRACLNRAGAYMHHGKSVVMQMYMSTTRGLVAPLEKKQ